MAITDTAGLPIAIDSHEASRHEVKLVEQTVESCFIEGSLERLVGDQACDSDPLDEKLENDYDIEMVSPHRTKVRPENN